MIKIAPSILAADPLNLERDIRRAIDARCDWIHIDVMDAHFVPNLAYSPDTVRALRNITSLPLDVHLMMDHPDTLMGTFMDAGADCITLHAEAEGDLHEMLRTIRNRGIKTGIAVRPATGIDVLAPYLSEADLILVMTVEPGFGGQKLDERVIGKISALREAGYRGEIEADGGIREDNLQELIRRGLTVAVMGTAVFHHKRPDELIERLHRM